MNEIVSDENAHALCSGPLILTVPSVQCEPRTVTLYCNILRVFMGSHDLIWSCPRGEKSPTEALGMLTR